jgi:hypothetical protein
MLMQTAAQVDFQGFEGSEAQKFAIENHLVNLERKFGAIIAGWISVRAPDAHHRKGAPFQVAIQLTLPGGREVDVSRTPDVDERYSNFAFALRDAFRRAEGQLLKEVDRMQGS